VIYIYSDGIYNNVHIQMVIQAVLPEIDVRFCTASMICDGCLKSAKLLIMPGGADLYFCEKLNGEANQIIKNFVRAGGRYFGSCAGAYYGCSSLDWNKGEIAGARELAFYNGCAIGPIYDWIENQDSIYEGSWVKAVKLQTAYGQEFLTQYNGGPVFTINSSSPPPSGDPLHQAPAQGGGNDARVLATYAELPDNPPAVIGGTYGQGRYILSSPHIERFGYVLTDSHYKLLNPSYDREQKALEALMPHEELQSAFFKSILLSLL
jgi:glutamine amidotransferase-like uncharacterized protein